ncbi:MAG: tripartite tricarboxylate transporter TctB family protein, partial [Deltaproteobacteria bacterium]|nr:tripartite tricarboxylate transporter TctB family protein [Deltaproteobacteria bacterium]
ASREIALSLSIFAGALVVRFLIIPNFIEQEESYDLASLSPAFFPELATWIIAGLALLLFFSTLFHRKTTGQREEERLNRNEVRRVYLVFGIVIVYLLAMKFLGFPITTMALLAGLFVLQGITEIKKIVLTSLLVTFGIYLFFLYIMQVHLPEGLLFK